MSDIELARALFARHRAVLMIDLVSQRFIEKCLVLIRSSDLATWTAGDDTQHSWRELTRRSLFRLEEVTSVKAIASILGWRVRRSFQWINYYGPGQYIPSHRDAAGDAHLLIGISVPPLEFGGQLWLERKSRLVPLGVGDALLFEASRIRHGTTAVLARANVPRVTFNIRFSREG
jgi:hypothetical protein